MFGLSRYQWLVLLAAWLGWGFDIFDSLLFNFVAPNCIVDLLNLTPGTAAARDATFWWAGLPTAVTFFVRMFVREPERWQQVRERSSVRLREIFHGDLARVTLLGTLVAVIALITWWSCNAFLPTLATGLAREAAQARGLDSTATLALIESWKMRATVVFNLGGLIGTLLTIPAAKYLGRRTLFRWYFAGSAAAIFITYGLHWAP